MYIQSRALSGRYDVLLEGPNKYVVDVFRVCPAFVCDGPSSDQLPRGCRTLQDTAAEVLALVYSLFVTIACRYGHRGVFHIFCTASPPNITEQIF